jgi:EmrB/QacA subfamily drug resistance transporter
MTASETEAALPPSRRQLWTAVGGLLLALTLAGLDQNIVSTALPQIVSDLGGLAHLAWVVTAFMLASTATAPLYGKLSDMYGRKPLFLAAIFVFLLGSALCGAAGSMTELILFRGLQGLGAGGLITLSQTTIADLVGPKERGHYQGLFTAVFAVCSVAGPLLGGVLTDELSWRWIFYINLPVGAGAVLLLIAGLRRPRKVTSHHIDYGGALFLTAGTTCILLALTWGGTMLPWTSPVILGLAGGALVLAAALVVQEGRASEPILPPRLFRCGVFVVAVLVLGLTGFALFEAMVFLPLFFQLVLGYSASQAGLLMAPVMAGVIVASIGGGRFVAGTGRYKAVAAAGLTTALAAFLVMTWATQGTASLAAMEVALVALGFGLGLVMPTLTVAIQNAVDRRDLGAATSAAMFFRSLGCVFGVALAGVIVNTRLHDLLPGAFAGSGEGVSLMNQGMQHINALPEAQRLAVVAAYQEAINNTFLAGALVAIVGLAAVAFLPPFGARKAATCEPQATPEAAVAVE